MRYLVLGASGQLGKEFVRRLSSEGFSFTAFSREELDITNSALLRERVLELRPKAVINCTAYNQVDWAEVEYERALQVNALSVLYLAMICREVGAILVHYSTDYVFDGTKEDLYREEDSPNPLNKYGWSKYIGEKLLLSIADNCLIFRTSWVYGEGKQNFLHKLNEWVRKQDYLRIACDEFSVPTSTRTIVEVTLLALQKGLTGLYHLVNTGYASRYEWAKEYFKIKGIKKFIYPAYQHEFNLPAKRPRWSAMSNEKICKELGIEIPEWQAQLKEDLKWFTNL
uniref:dTDP-4-dehydrorhamnose reductase n=1 Tax=Caldimicrobium thiodismutans TaxID=1653476 RepID=A0A832GN07_9BACT